MGPSQQLRMEQASLSILPLEHWLPMSFMVPHIHICSKWSMPTSPYLEFSCHCMDTERHPSSSAERQLGIHRADPLLLAVSKDTRGFETKPFDS